MHLSEPVELWESLHLSKLLLEAAENCEVKHINNSFCERKIRFWKLLTTWKEKKRFAIIGSARIVTFPERTQVCWFFFLFYYWKASIIYVVVPFTPASSGFRKFHYFWGGLLLVVKCLHACIWKQTWHICSSLTEEAKESLILRGGKKR